MKIPGFTAGASLYKTSERYRMVGVLDLLTDSQEVLPQRRPHAKCIVLDEQEWFLIFRTHSDYGGMVCSFG